MMSFEEYNAKMNWYAENITEDNEEMFEEMCEFQREYMLQILEKLKADCDSKAKEAICELVEYAVNNSESGSSCVCVDSKEIADEVDNIIWETIGEYLLDYDVYKDTNGNWTIDCMFAGNYVPYWNGWFE